MKHTFRATIDHVPEPTGRVVLAVDDGRHLVRVARLGVGDAIEVIDPLGQIWPSVIEDVGPPTSVRVDAELRQGPSTLPLDLYIGALEWGRFDLVVEKCTEIGVAHITMFRSERAGVKANQDGFDKRQERLVRLADAAAKQSGRGRRPDVRGLVPFSTVVAEIAAGTGFLLDGRGERALGATLRQAAPTRAALIIGSDAGFSDTEVALATSAGVQVCRLGESTLRAETAALVAVAIAADGLGAMGAA
jgi:16S rRNA (uracil1498-N3)-methyltransferase